MSYTQDYFLYNLLLHIYFGLRKKKNIYIYIRSIYKKEGHNELELQFIFKKMIKYIYIYIIIL